MIFDLLWLDGHSLMDLPYAERRAREMGWVLNLDVLGHRVSDYPHSIYKAGDLGAFDRVPVGGVYIVKSASPAELWDRIGEAIR